MYDSPGYLWVITVAGVFAIPALTCVVLYGGARRSGLGRGGAAAIAGSAAVILGGWFTVSAMIAGRGWYHTRIGHEVPWMPIAVVGFLGTLLLLSRIPVVTRALEAPGMMSDLVLPHMFRVAGVSFLIAMFLGHLPALFAIPAGLGDIAVGFAAPRVALRLRRGTGLRTARWFNILGMADLVVALTLGGIVGFQLFNITPSGESISELPLALIPTAVVPLLLTLHIISMRALARARRTPVTAATSVLVG